HQAIIDSARAFLRQADQTLTDDLRELATELVDLNTMADQRLRRCEDFLRRGLLGEAIHQAEIEPPVLDIVGLLDFPERVQFEEVLGMYGLPVAPRLDVQRAMALNHAYTEYEPIANLLRDYRRLALSRAPLGDRLSMLRQIAQADPGNPN